MTTMIPLDEDGFDWSQRDAADRQDILTNIAERFAGVHGDPDSAEKRLAVLGEIEGLRAALDRVDLNAGWYARDSGATWQAIAEAAGLTTRAGARYRYANDSPEERKTQERERRAAQRRNA